MRRWTTNLTAAASACLITLSLAATSPATAESATSAAPRRLDATLRGGADGDANGTGHAAIRLNRATGRVCATVTFAKIGQPNAAHIHRKSDGGIVVDLSGSVTGGAKCATGVRKRVIRNILLHPKRYYFNVHNTKFPAGAIRGTLHR